VGMSAGGDYRRIFVRRHRSGLRAGQPPEKAAITAQNTTRRALRRAGTTVCVAILGLLALQVSFLYGVAVSIALAVALTMLASLTLLPAMLGFLGPRVLRKAERATAGTERPDRPGGWYRWAHLVNRKAAVSSVLGFAAIVALALPFFSMRLGLPDASTDPAASTTHQAYELLAEGFGPGFNGPLQLVGQGGSPADHDRFAAYAGSLRGQPGVARVGPPRGISLVIAGGQNRFLSKHELDEPARLKLGDWVKWAGWVDAKALAAFYQMSQALLMPSLFESFGLPIVEAMASGCPVVTSDCYGAKEIAADAAMLVDPASVESIAEGLERVLNETALRTQLIERGYQRSSLFTWKRCANQTLRVLQGAAGT